MTTAEAQRIIKSLADGRCPATNRPLSLDDPFQHPNVVEALGIAVGALDRLQRSEQRQANLPEHTGKPWDHAEEEQLSAEFNAGKSVAEIAEIHQRTRGAICA
jgi:hypothetical protein